MFNPLLATKLSSPPLRANAVRRPRLTGRLAQGCLGALTLVSAPAGYGKTTLLSEWLTARAGVKLSTAYLALDGDDDPHRFMAYLAAALAALAPTLAVDPPTPSRPHVWKPWLGAVLNQIALADTPLVLILDDYHRIRSETVHAAMSFVLDHLPAQLHLVIATRADPPLPIARLRALGQLTEIRAAELAFDEREAASFLAHTVNVSLAARDAAGLHALTEGWPVGMQLAALALQDRPAGQQPALADFSGRHRYVCDYLVDQVLSQQPEEVQTFMLATSVLGRLTAPLCDALTGRPGSARLLSELARSNLFLLPFAAEGRLAFNARSAGKFAPSDDFAEGMRLQPQGPTSGQRERVYRYHPLMLGCLRERLQQLATIAEIRQLHTRASRWHEQHGFPAHAIHHALAADEFERAALLIDRAAEPAMAHAEVETILGWLKALPESLVRARPGLCVWYAWTLCLTGCWQGIEPWLHAAESQLNAKLPPAGARTLYCRSKLGEIAAIRALAARLQGDFPRSFSQSQLARASLQEDDLVVRSVVAQNLGVTYACAGKYEEGRRALAEAEHSSLSAGHPYIYVGTLVQRARLCVLQRRLPEAIAIYRQAREHAEREALPSMSAKVSAELAGVLCAHKVLLDPLTPRELEVLRLIAAGRSTPEVAAELVISAGTVRNHLKNIYGKLGAHTRLQAVDQARALNVV